MSNNIYIYADLHTHSCYSDGFDTPNEIVAKAKNKNIKVMAICDHDTIEGQIDFFKEAKKNSINYIPSVEITTSINKVRIHVLGYYIDINNKDLLIYLASLSKARTDNTKNIFNNLCEMKKINYTWDKVIKYNKNRKWISSLHVYNSLKIDGLINPSISWLDFYFELFSEKSAAYEDINGFFPEDAIDHIKKAGGIAIIAHPKLINNDNEVQKMIKHGVDGLEVYYPAHNKNDILKYSELAKDNNLIISGGSDYHGETTGGYAILGECGLDKKQYLKYIKMKERGIYND